MSVYFLGDPHLGHRNIAKYRPFVSSSQENTNLIVSEWKATIKKRDVIYVMGDVAFDLNSIDMISWLPGTKILIKGNHDDMVDTASQSRVFTEIHGMLKYKRMWLSHAPLHPDELRGKPNVHGHVHLKSVMKRNWFGKKVLDRRYLNTCPDVIYPKYGKCILSLDEVRSYFATI